MKVKVIGTGGIGLCLLPPLCRVLNFGSNEYSFDNVEVALIDGDQFEERNKPRQPFRKRGNKAESWLEDNAHDYPNIEFRAHPTYLDEDNIGFFVEEYDYVFLCVDNHKTRRLVSLHCEQNLENVNLISGGNGLYDGNAMVYLKKNGENLTLPLHATHAPSGQTYHPEILQANDLHPNEVSKQEGCVEMAESEPQLLITNNYVAALMLADFHGILTGEFQGLFHRDDTHFNIRANTVQTFNYSGTDE